MIQWYQKGGALREGIAVAKCCEMTLCTTGTCSAKVLSMTLLDEFMTLRAQAKRCRKVSQRDTEH